ncbi:hypothetical protein [Roseivirga thermotolerans]|uniref:Uncharacterized protein n=1 Tax=Roseivirga thermotolerans TaxID=1758176 RepID=A0ABQ3I5Y7_9BACT|nr:hypothetical protein [Roseivirga thermotolerans]GHE65023.1 hypothetical protein GCM10011340_20060 [Roseivirga thermotolerans]
MISFTNETTYRDYWQTVAESIEAITSFRYGDQEQKNFAARTAMGTGIILWVDPLPVISGEGEMDGLCGRAVVNFAVMQVSGKNDTHLEKESKRAACSGLVMDVFKKLKADFLSGTTYGNQPDFSKLKFGSADDEIIGSTPFVGSAAEIPFILPLEL